MKRGDVATNLVVGTLALVVALRLLAVAGDSILEALGVAFAESVTAPANDDEGD